MPSPDPKHIVTPDAFRLCPDLLGAPLATPKRRLAALLVDLLLAAIAAQVAGWLIGVAVAVAFFRIVMRRKVQHPVKAWGRGAAAVAGALALFVVTIAVLDGDDDDDEGVPGMAYVGAGSVPGTGGASGAERDANEEISSAIQAAIEEGEMDEDDLDDLQEIQGSAWLPARVREMTGALLAGAQGDTALSDAERAEAADLLRRYADALAAADSLALDSLETPAGEVVAGRRLRLLRMRADRLEERVDALDDENEELHEAADNPSFFRSVRSVANDVGLKVGWVGLYFVLSLAWWGGRTPGKQLFGLRVARLDGRPISLWVAFERFGGYAAGLATGLLGFFQVFWDPNRQAIHDKIAMTVVVRTRGKEGDEEATVAEEEERTSSVD